MQDAARVKSLLLVDDSRDYCTLVERAFRQVQPGTAVFALSDGQSAIEHLALCGNRYPVPDLVLLDRVMPGGPDGYDVLRCLRRIEALRGLPVLMISGSDDESHVTQAREAGADGYIVKPGDKSDYPQLARQVLAWWQAEKRWSKPGPLPGQSCLAAAGRELGLPSAMALHPSAAPIIQTLADGQNTAEQGRGFLDWVKQAVQEAFDPFLLAFSQACRRHRITPNQAMQVGGSHRLIANRRAVMVELIAEGWPDETLQEVFTYSRSEFKRLHAEARAKVGPKLDPLLS